MHEKLHPPHWKRAVGYSNGISARGRMVLTGGLIGAAYRDVLGKNFPAIALVQVADLVEDRAKVEIEATAIVPD